MRLTSGKLKKIYFLVPDSQYHNNEQSEVDEVKETESFKVRQNWPVEIEPNIAEDNLLLEYKKGLDFGKITQQRPSNF